MCPVLSPFRTGLVCPERNRCKSPARAPSAVSSRTSKRRSRTRVRKTMNFARAYRLLLGVSTFVPATGADAQVRREFTAVHMGVPVRMVLHSSSELVAAKAARAAFARIAELDDKMSDYRPQSEVRMLPERPGDWQSVSPDLFAVLARAEEGSRNSGGLLHLTLRPLGQVGPAPGPPR